MRLLLALVIGSLLWLSPAQAAGSKKAPSPRATAGKVSSTECQRYVEHLIELESADFAARDPEMGAMSASEQAASLALIRAQAAKQPEIAGELADCIAGKITRAELECSVKATSAAAADQCIGL